MAEDSFKMEETDKETTCGSIWDHKLLSNLIFSSGNSKIIAE